MHIVYTNMEFVSHDLMNTDNNLARYKQTA